MTKNGIIELRHFMVEKGALAAGRFFAIRGRVPTTAQQGGGGQPSGRRREQRKKSTGAYDTVNHSFISQKLPYLYSSIILLSAILVPETAKHTNRRD